MLRVATNICDSRYFAETKVAPRDYRCPKNTVSTSLFAFCPNTSAEVENFPVPLQHFFSIRDRQVQLAWSCPGEGLVLPRNIDVMQYSIVTQQITCMWHGAYGSSFMYMYV